MQSDYTNFPHVKKDPYISSFETPSSSLSPGREEEERERDELKEVGGLSISNKDFDGGIKKIKVVNRETGEVIEIDKDLARISRMRKRIFAWAETMKPYLNDKAHFRTVMITLTYRGVLDWKPNHIRDYMKELRKRIGENLVCYAWVAELQKRGAVHYHVLLAVKKGTFIPKPDESGMWAHGMSKIETAKTHFYICTYVGKEYQKKGTFPKGLRMFSVWISKGVISSLERWFFRLSAIPAWFVKKIKDNMQLKKWKREEGGGWSIDGKIYQSPYKLLTVF